jgi:hypothetical protein
MAEKNNPSAAPERRPRKPRKPRKPRVPEIPAPSAPATLADAIAETAAAPKSVTVDGQTVQAQDLRQLIEADRYLASKKAARRPGLQFDKMVPPGAE